MTLFHGSYVEIINPDISYSRKTVDFGVGFYLTTLYGQAENWCQKFKNKGKNAVISEYNFDESGFEKYKTINFESYSIEWLDFIIECRSGKDTTDYEIVMGGVANDKVFNTIELFFDGLIDKSEAIKRLKYEKPNYQIALRSQRVIDNCLKFERSIIL